MKEEQKVAAKQFLDHVTLQIMENSVDIKHFAISEFGSFSAEEITVALTDKISIHIRRTITV